VLISRRSILLAPTGLMIDGATDTWPPAVIPNVQGAKSPLGWKIGFFDDFTSWQESRTAETATTDSTSLWATDYGPPNNHTMPREQEYYCNLCHTPGITPFSQRDSILAITASVPTPTQLAMLRSLPEFRKSTAQFISGVINTRRMFPQNLSCGYFELNCKLPRGTGMWAAFWLWGPPEIDIMEQVALKNSLTTGTLHFGEKNAIQHLNVVNTDVGVDLTESFHTYGGLWTPRFTAWYFDGRLLGSSQGGIQDGAGYYNVNNRMRVVINLALGTGQQPKPAMPADLPARFEIDWFRYSQMDEHDAI
jgi:Glycosyl hydrolases family 16